MRVGPVHPPRSGRCDLTPAFWEGVRGSRRRLLMLDYDGTLTSFHLASTEDVAGFLERWGTEAGRARSGPGADDPSATVAGRRAWLMKT